MKRRLSLSEKRPINQTADDLKRQLYSRLLNVALVFAAAVTVAGFSAYAWFVNNPTAQVSTQQYKVYGSEDPNLGMDIEYAELHDEANDALDPNIWRKFDENVQFHMDPGDYIAFRLKIINSLTEPLPYSIKFGGFSVSLPTDFANYYSADVIAAGKYTYGESAVLNIDTFETNADGSYIIENGNVKSIASPITSALFNGSYFDADTANDNSFIQPLTNALKYNVSTGENYYFPQEGHELDFTGFDLFDGDVITAYNATIAGAQTGENGVQNSTVTVYITLWFDPSVTTAANVNIDGNTQNELTAVTMNNSNGYIGQTLEINKIYVEGAS